MLTVNAPPPCVAPPSGLVGWWRGEDNALDQLGTNNGTLTGGATFASGEVGQGFSLNGKSGYISLSLGSSNLPLGKSPRTIEAWVKTTLSGLGEIFSYGVGNNGEAFTFGIWGASIFVSSWGGPRYTVNAPVNNGAFHHVAVTYDGTNASVFYDGTLLDTRAFANNTVNGSANIGARIGPYEFFNGVLDEVSIYNRALAAAEIQAIYNAGSGGKCGFAPSIKTPPQSQTVQCSSNASFAVSATGMSPLVYQWYFGSNSVSGATNTLLTLTNVGFAQAGSYSVVVTNAYGSATGGPAVLTVVDTITAIDTTPPFVLACVLELAVQFDTNCQALLPDLTTTNYIIASDNCSSVSVAQTPPALTALPVGTNIVLLTVSDSASNQTTRAVAVIVPGAPHIAAQPTNLSAVLSSNATFSVLACGAAPLLYQWQHSSTNLPGATNAVLTLSYLSTNNAGQYQVVITNSFGSITSVVAALTVLQPPVITRQPRNAVAAPGATVSFSVAAKGLTPLAYQWQKTGAPLAGQTQSSLTLSNVQPPDFAGYAVGITNTDGGVLGAVATLTLAASPLINSGGFNLSTFMLAVPTEVGPTYVVECKNDLEDPSWNVLATLSGTGLSIPISDNGLTNATRFYRVRVR